MAQFCMVETICYYDGIQLALVCQRDDLIMYVDDLYLMVQTLDDEVYLATRLSTQQEDMLKTDSIDVKSLMTNPYLDEIYIIIHPHLGSKYIQSKYSEFYGFRVDEFNPSFVDWGIPLDGLYYGDH